MDRWRKALFFAVTPAVLFATTGALGQVYVFEQKGRGPYDVLLKRAGDGRKLDFFDLLFKRIVPVVINPGMRRSLPLRISAVKVAPETVGLLVKLKSPIIEILSSKESAGMRFALQVSYDLQPQVLYVVSSGFNKSYDWRDSGPTIPRTETLSVYIPLNDLQDQVVFTQEPQVISLGSDAQFAEAVPARSPFAGIESAAANTLRITGRKSGTEHFTIHYKLDGKHKIGERDLVVRMEVSVAEEKYDMEEAVTVKGSRKILPQKKGRFIKIMVPANAGICAVTKTEDGELRIAGNREGSTDAVVLAERYKEKDKVLSIVTVNLKVKLAPEPSRKASPAPPGTPESKAKSKEAEARSGEKKKG